MVVAAVHAIRSSSSLNCIRNISFVVIFCWNSFERCCFVFNKKNHGVHRFVLASSPFVDHISVIMLFHFRWSNQIKGAQQHRFPTVRCRRHRVVGCCGDRDCVFCCVCFIFNAWSLRYPAEPNNATGFFYMIIICSVINTLTPERMNRIKKNGINRFLLSLNVCAPHRCHSVSFYVFFWFGLFWIEYIRSFVGVFW